MPIVKYEGEKNFVVIKTYHTATKTELLSNTIQTGVKIILISQSWKSTGGL